MAVSELLSACERLDDEQLERALFSALATGDTASIEEHRAEARRRYAGKMGLPIDMMEDCQS